MNEAPSGTVGDALLASLADHVDYIFANTGTDHPSLIEAYARAEVEDLPAPIAMAVPHENLAACMAYGHTMISGRPQAVLVHVGVGTANALIGLLDARRERVPMLLMAGRTPILESGARGARTRYIHWARSCLIRLGWCERRLNGTTSCADLNNWRTQSPALSVSRQVHLRGPST